MRLIWFIGGAIVSLALALFMLLAIIFDNIYFAFLCGAAANAVLILFLSDIVDSKHDEE